MRVRTGPPALIRLIVAFGVLVAAGAVTAPAATAAPVVDRGGARHLDLQLVTRTDTGTATATCPQGTKLFGLGGATSRPGSGPFLRTLVPDADLTRATVTASNSSTTVTVQAICGPAAEDMTLVTGSGVGTASATCPAGATLYGLGAEINGGSRDAYLMSLVPDLDPPTATARLNAAVSVTAYAICAAPATVMGLKSEAESILGTSKTVIASCPTGTHVSSSSAAVSTTSDRLKVVLDQVVTDPNLRFVVATGHSATFDRWKIEATAICTA